MMVDCAQTWHGYRNNAPMGTLQRYDGRDLGTGPHIAVLGSCKVGNFVVTIPLLRARSIC